MGDRPEAVPASYAAAGVNLEAADEAVKRIAALVASTQRPEVLDGIGGFGGSFALDVAALEAPVLVASTDGVGTKLAVAQAAGRYDTVGVDLVAMCVDDLVCVGAEPLFMLDYISTGRLDPDQVEALVGGVAAGCRLAGCALLGGELAEHPGEMEPGTFDMAGFAVGVVDRDARLGPANVVPGDILVGLSSPGLRSNGYSLARHVLLERAGRSLDEPAWDGAGVTLADEMLRPSVIYSPAVLAAARTGAVRAAAHITGGGIPGNLVRAMPEACIAVVDTSRWDEPRIFEEIRRLGPVDDTEMQRVFNLGIGMVLVVAADAADEVERAVEAEGIECVVVGRVDSGTRGVRLIGPD
ncbi:MAG: phosphoribosylformylglycinamidine cyclo-ligase [Acidimicrobiales bacterium]